MCVCVLITIYFNGKHLLIVSSDREAASASPFLQSLDVLKSLGGSAQKVLSFLQAACSDAQSQE